MTAEERREKDIAESGVICAFGEKAPSHGCACSNCVGVVEAYEAGRSSMQEDAAKVAERMLNGKGIAAAIRALKP